MVQLGEHFASEGPGRESEWARQRRWFIKARHDNQRREELADRLDDSASALSAAVAIASEAQVREFRVKLDAYDGATVEALMENQRQLDAASTRIEIMLDQAHVKEDGRRVFRTEDGTRVFDEFGAEVGAVELDPQIIDPTAPTWEVFSTEIEQRDQLVQERTEIIEFQEKLDLARERIDGDEISEADLEALDAELLDAMPLTVQRNVPGLDAIAPQLSNDADSATQAAPQEQQKLSASVGSFAPTGSIRNSVYEA